MKLIKAGESHGEAIVGIIENVPFGLEINEGEINCLLAERSGAAAVIAEGGESGGTWPHCLVAHVDG